MARSPSIWARIAAIDAVSGPARRIGRALNNSIGRPLRSIDRFATGAAKKVGGFLKGAATALIAVGTAGAVALGGFTAHAAEMGKFADSVGLSVEALQELKFAAQQSGVTGDEFTEGMKEFTLRMGQLKAGEGTLLGFLDKVSPALRKQVEEAKDNETAFMLLTSAMHALEDPAETLALADAAFGGTGVILHRLGTVGVQGVQKLRLEARALGVVTTEQVKDATTLSDAWGTTKKAMGGAAATIAGPLLKAFAPLAQRATEYLKANGPIIQGTITAALGKLAQVWGRVVGFVRSVDWAPFVDGFMQAVAIFRPMILEIWTAFRDNFGSIFEFVKVVVGGIALFFAMKFGVILAVVRNVAANFTTIWEGVKSTLAGFIEFVRGVFTLDMQRVMGGLGLMFTGLGKIFSGVWKTITGTFKDSFKLINDLMIKFTPDPIKKAWSGLTGFFGDLWDGVALIFRFAWDSIVMPVVRGAQAVAGFLADPLGGAPEVPTITGDHASAAGVAEGLANRNAERNRRRNMINNIGANPLAGGIASIAPASSHASVAVTFENVPPGLKVVTTTTGPASIAANVGTRQVGVTGAP